MRGGGSPPRSRPPPPIGWAGLSLSRAPSKAAAERGGGGAPHTGNGGGTGTGAAMSEVSGRYRAGQGGTGRVSPFSLYFQHRDGRGPARGRGMLLLGDGDWVGSPGGSPVKRSPGSPLPVPLGCRGPRVTHTPPRHSLLFSPQRSPREGPPAAAEAPGGQEAGEDPRPRQGVPPGTGVISRDSPSPRTSAICWGGVHRGGFGDLPCPSSVPWRGGGGGGGVPTGCWGGSGGARAAYVLCVPPTPPPPRQSR